MRKIDYKKLSERKNKIGYDTKFYSSSYKEPLTMLGTIEKDASGHFGKHTPEKFRGVKIFDIFKKKNFKSVLDIGAGKMEVTEILFNMGKQVDVCEYEDSYYLSQSEIMSDNVNKFYFGDFNEIEFDNNYDAIWASHILEHQLNPNIFLKKIFSILNEGGYLSIVIPPRKPFIVGGHVSMWNGGLLLYHLVLAGFDCSDIQLLQYDYNIGIVLKKKSIVNFPKIRFDLGDLDILKKYFPLDIEEGFNGDIMNININE
tara:strand:- start:8489 stop:9259 length:771 start_codon:yes stop_codon:yes gene_type:complete